MGAMCYSKATKIDILILSIERKTCMKATCYTKNIHHIERVLKESMYNKRRKLRTSCQNLIKFFEPSRK